MSVTSFINNFNSHNVNGIAGTFCQNDTTVTPNAPCVGITDHGPRFTLQAGVTTLFGKMFTTFQNLKWNDVKATWVNQPAATPSWAGNLGGVTSEVVVQFWLTGKYQNDWFQPGDGTGYDSDPLSNLKSYPHGQQLRRSRMDTSGKGLPGVALFSLDDQGKIRQLQMYLDRYALMQGITQNKGDWDEKPNGN